MIQMTIVCAPDKIREPLRSMTRMQLIRTLAAWRPDLTAYRQVEEAYRISLKSLARRYLELHDEVSDLDDMIGAIVKDLAPELLAQTAIGLNSAIHIIAIGRLRLDPRSQDYVAKRIAAGHSKLEAIRCLKRYIAREVFGIIIRRHREINQSQIAA